MSITLPKPRMSPVLFYTLLKRTGHEWIVNNTARMGAALAFYSVLSLSPLLLLVLTAAAAIWGKEAAQGQILDQMRGILGTQGATAIQDILAAASRNQHAGIIASLTGFGMLIFSASGVFGELQNAINTIWRVKTPKDRPVWTMLRERFMSFAMVVGSGFLLLVSLLLSAWLAAVTHYINDMLPATLIIMQLFDFAFSFSVITLLFAMAFKVVPDTFIPWRNVWWGAALTALLFMLGKTLIGIYLGYAGIASSYGAAGSIVVVLVWVYYSAQILFFGAEFTYVYSLHNDPKPTIH